MQGMTTWSTPTNQKDERIGLLRMLLASDPGDRQPHESYAANNQEHFTRKDFGWAKAQFAEFVLRSVLDRTPLPVPPKLQFRLTGNRNRTTIEDRRAYATQLKLGNSDRVTELMRLVTGFGGRK